jgi:hypothetical protein
VILVESNHKSEAVLKRFSGTLRSLDEIPEWKDHPLITLEDDL